VNAHRSPEARLDRILIARLSGTAIRHSRAGHVADLERLAADYVGDRSKLRTISRDDLRARLRDGDVVVLVVRPEAEYTAGHVRGAISIQFTT
jgi:hypothetical protein